MSYWILGKMDETDDVVELCEPCALSATNMALASLNEPPMGTMHEAAVIIATLAAMAGIDNLIKSRPTGRCEECER